MQKKVLLISQKDVQNAEKQDDKNLKKDSMILFAQHAVQKQKFHLSQQKAKKYYGLLEKQFHHYFELAEKMPGMQGENLLKLLESRLDNVVYRAGFAMSRPEARQLVSHAHFTVNGKKVNIPSYLVKAGDVIAIRESSMDSDKVKGVLEANASRPALNWLSVDRAKAQATVVSLPERSEIDLQVAEHLIVELYSK